MKYDDDHLFSKKNYVHPRHRIAIELIILIFETIIKTIKYLYRTTIHYLNKTNYEAHRRRP